MMKAAIKKSLEFKDYPDVEAGIVNWPMSDIRLTSANTAQLIDLGTHIIDVWDHYSDESLDIKAFDGDTRHHTVTPIMHRDGDRFVLDLVLRDNNTSDQYPLDLPPTRKAVAHQEGKHRPDRGHGAGKSCRPG